MDEQEMRMQMWLTKGDFKTAEQLLAQEDAASQDAVILKCLFQIYDSESKNKVPTVFDHTTDLHALSEHYKKTKLLIRRLEFDIEGEAEFYDYCEKNQVSEFFIARILQNNVFEAEKVCKKLIHAYEAEGKTKETAYFRSLLKQLEDHADE